MKHAICVLAYKDIDYMKKFIDQFENHTDIEFYIHWHKHNKKECLKLKSYSQNIKYICNQFDTLRFSKDLVMAELHLYYIASQNPNVCMCHLYSESDFIICPIQYFIDYYNERLDNNFITYITDDPRVIYRKHSIFNKYEAHKASQWKSLNINTVKKLLQNLSLADELINLFIDHKMLIPGALDEYIIPTVLKLKCNIGINCEECKHYTNWENRLLHPNELTMTMLSNPKYHLYDDKILSNIAIRKIDVMNNDSLSFLNLMRRKFLQKLHK